MTGQDASQWYIARDGKQTGPISEAEIKAIAQHGYFRSTDLVWRPGFAEWTPALTVFKPAVREATAPPVAAPAPAPAPVLQPQAPQNAQQAAQSAPQPQTYQPSSQPSTQPASSQASQPAPGWAQSPANIVPAPRATSGRRAPGPIAADAAAYDDAVRSGDPRFAGQAPAPSTAPAPSGYAPGGQPQGPQPGPAKIGPAPFSNRPAQPESAKLPVAPPYRGEGNYRPQGDAGPAGPGRETTGRPAGREQAPSGSAAPQLRRAMATVDAGPEPEAKPRSRKGLYVVGTVVMASLAGGIWVAANPGVLEGLPSVKSLSIALPSSSNKTADLEARWQQTAHWPVIKREFPDWYGERLREAVQLASESKPDDEINKTLVDQLITLRRQNSAQALAASTPKLRALATAFLANLRQLKAQSTTACFNFISQGEGTAGVIDQFQVMDGTKSTMQLQVAAIFEAIGEGRKSPVTHEKPIKTDYDALMDQLGKLGWSQTDVATFADPKALARAEPARVCQMVQDWFVAHISITDEAAQERLLGETLRPVVSG